jgi:hypothetical protein
MCRVVSSSVRVIVSPRPRYEGYPMALITEQAGGCASTGMFEGQVRVGGACCQLSSGARDCSAPPTQLHAATQPPAGDSG